MLDMFLLYMILASGLSNYYLVAALHLLLVVFFSGQDMFAKDNL